MGDAVPDPFHHAKRHEMNELHTCMLREVGTFWHELQFQKHRHVQAKLSRHFGVTNTRTQEQTAMISESTKTVPPSQRAVRAAAAFPQARFAIPRHSKSSVQQPWCSQSQTFLAGSTHAALDLNNKSHSWSSCIYLKINKRETGYQPEINTPCFASCWRSLTSIN